MIKRIVVPYELYELYDWEKLRNFMELFNEHGTLWNLTIFTFCWTICRYCIAELAAPNTFPH